MVDLVFLGLNDIGERVYDWLTDRDDVAVRALLTDADQLDLVAELEPDLLISSGFRHIVPEEVLDVPERGAVNFHKAYLPHNRGANPNVWSIVEDAPAGVSLHYMTSDIDGGPIIDRREVPIRPDDTGRDLYERLEDAQFEQFREVWPDIRDDTVDATPQDQLDTEGSYHRKQDFLDLWELDPDETVRVGDFLDRLRALTFPPYRNAYVVEESEKYHVDLRIRPADSGGRTGGGGGDVPGDGGDGSEGPAAKNVPTYTEDGDN